MQCPKCGKYYTRLLAVSRKDGKTLICDMCGHIEAIEAIESHTGKTHETEELLEFVKNNRKLYMN